MNELLQLQNTNGGSLFWVNRYYLLVFGDNTDYERQDAEKRNNERHLFDGDSHSALREEREERKQFSTQQLEMEN